MCVNMGKRRGKLRELGLKRIPRKIWVSKGFGQGYYKFRNHIMLPTGEVAHLCESKDGLKQWSLTEKSPTLADMGLKMNEYGQIVLTKKV